MKKIDVHIDTLVLRGFRREDRHGLAAGLQQELVRMFSDPQTARQLVAQGDVSRLGIGTVTFRAGAAPRQVGVQVARGIDRRMKR